MTVLKNIFKILATTALLSSANAFSADFLVDTSIDDTGDYVHGGDRYAIDKMDVKWADSGLITVDIYTNFVGNNAKSYGGNNKNIVFGDLLIGTGGANTPFDYAFVLSEGRNGDYKENNDRWVYDNSNNDYHRKDRHWDKQGTLTEIGSTKTSKDYHGDPSNTANGEVMAGNTIGNGRQGAWSVDNYGDYYYDSNNNKTDKISFSFNVNGIDAFQNASQLAFSWAMSCANDVVDGVVSVNRPTSVPEPATLILMLIALGIMAKSRKTKADKFSA